MQMHEEEAPDTLEAGGPTQTVAVGRDPGAAGVADSSGCALAAPASSRSPRRTTRASRRITEASTSYVARLARLQVRSRAPTSTRQKTSGPRAGLVWALCCVICAL